MPAHVGALKQNSAIPHHRHPPYNSHLPLQPRRVRPQDFYLHLLSRPWIRPPQMLPPNQALLDNNLRHNACAGQRKDLLGTRVPGNSVHVDGAGAGSAALEPVVFGEFECGEGVLDGARPEFRDVVGVEVGKALKGINQFMTVGSGWEATVGAGAGVGLGWGQEGKEAEG